MTPEQKLRKQFEFALAKYLPRGRYFLQPIETSSLGVPDYYLSVAIGDPAKSIQTWIETKTTDYYVNPYQINWQHKHALAGGTAYILTHLGRVPPYPGAAQPTPPRPTRAPTTSSGLYVLNYDDKMLNHSTLGRYIEKEQPNLVALEDWLKEQLEF